VAGHTVLCGVFTHLQSFACFTALSTPVASSPSTGDVSLHCLPQNILLAWYFEELAFVEA
jgi:hypothetical protein